MKKILIVTGLIAFQFSLMAQRRYDTIQTR